MVRKSKDRLLTIEDRLRLVEDWLDVDVSKVDLEGFFDACEKMVVAKQRTPYWVGTNSKSE